MNLASFIDHTLLKADCTLEEIKRVCAEAIQYQFAAVCIPPFYVNQAADLLADSTIKVATVVGFPMGYPSTPAKVEEIKKAVDDGADEVDAVINLCAVKNGNWSYIRNDIDSMIMAAHLKGKAIKIILETGLLEEVDIRRICDICLEVQPDFVKTSTGFNGEGATVEVVQLLKSLLNDQIKIKASGGIRTKTAAIQLLEAGAKRIGSSSSVKMLQEA